MNNNEKYQDDFQMPTGVPINQSTDNTSGYNDTYYEQSYSDNKYNEYEEPKKSFPWKIVIIVVLALIFIFLVWWFLLGNGSNSSGNAKYEALTAELCEKALEYERTKEGIIDRKTPGATAYIRVQNLVDNYLLESKPIKDPRYKSSLFKKSDYKEYISFDSYLRLAVASNGEPYCEGFVDTSDDHNKPILSLKGTTPITIAKGTNFEDPGARATDDVDGDITDKIVRSGTVDISTVGEYTITYTVSDTSGNTSTVTRKIIVQEYQDLEVTLGSHFDTITPVIELKGSNPYCIELGTKYKEPGATATDNVDGNITNRIIVDSSQVTGTRSGNFRVTYTVSDTFGHKAIAYRSVMVKEKCANDVVINNPVNNRPVISVIGKSAITISLGELYEDLGATAWDKEDGNITSSIKTTNNVNTKIAQIYTVTYTVVDSGGLRATAKRTVTVKDPNAVSNVATFDGGCPGNIRIPLGTEQAIPVPTAKDSQGRVLTVRTQTKDSTGAIVTTGINYYRSGVYTTEYFAKPTNGVEQLCSRTVTIYDEVAPSLSLSNPIFIPVRTENCNINVEDLKASGMIVSDAPNQVAPEVFIAGGDNKACTLDSNGFELTVTAKDNSGNSTVKKTKVYVVSTLDGGDPTEVKLGNCGTNGELYMFVGDKTNIMVQVYPINATNSSVTWSSTLSQYATVAENGEVTALAVGSTDVTAKTVVGNKTAICKIVVRERSVSVPVTGVNITGCESGQINLTKGTSKSLSAAVAPTNASNKSVSWISSKTDVATINTSGVVTGVAIGESIIKVTTQDGNKTKDCKVVVRDSNITDTTAPSKVEVLYNNANEADPYNKSGNWMGGTKGNQVLITVKATDFESAVTSFEMYNSKGEKIDSAGILVSKCYDITANLPSEEKARCMGINANTSGIYTAVFMINKDISDQVTFKAVNEAMLSSEASDQVNVKLDNTGPKTTFSAWIEDPNKWVSEPKVVVKYASDDMNGSGIVKYHFTHDDVKAKDIKPEDIKYTDAQTAVELTFEESNLNKFVYVRAVDALGNLGPWTEKPSYLNMDTVAPLAPELTLSNNDTTSVQVAFKFIDGVSPKPSGFGKYEYFLNSNAGITKNDENPVSFTEAGSYQMRVWAWDKAGNKSGTYSQTNFTVKAASSGGNNSGGNNSGGAIPTNLSVSVTNCPIDLKAGETKTISISTTGFTSNATISLESLDSGVVRVENNAARTVTGVSSGVMTVRVKAIEKFPGSDDFTVKTVNCSVNVSSTPPKQPTTCQAYGDPFYTSGVCQATGQVGDYEYKRCKYAYQQKRISGSGTINSNYVYSSSTEAMNACKKNVTTGYACENTPVRTYTYRCIDGPVMEY